MSIEFKKTLEEKLMGKINQKTFDSITENISESLTSFQIDLQAHKIRKYECNTKDYAEGKVCDWHGARKKFSSRRPPVFSKAKDLRFSTVNKRESSEGGDMEEQIKSSQLFLRPPRTNQRTSYIPPSSTTLSATGKDSD